MTPHIHIMADDREWQSNIHTLLQENPEVSLDIGRLPVGDFMINEQLIVERKTIVDFATSIKDGRLFKQIISIVDTHRTGMLILEGNGYQLSKTGISREVMQGALTYITLFLGIHLLRSENTRETVQLMLYAGRKMEIIKKPHRLTQKYNKKSLSLTKKHKTRIILLQNIPGIGQDKAQRLLEHFGNIKGIFNATLKEITAIPGIGKKLAENIYKMAN